MNDIGIVNAALAHLGEDATETIDLDQARSSVRKVLRHLEDARDAVLSRWHWRAAMAYETLTAVDGLGDWRFPFVFDLPPAALRVVEVYTAGTACPPAWEIGTRETGEDGERRVIRCKTAGPLDVGYVWRIAWTSMPTPMADAVGFELAARSCVNVNGDIEKAADLRKKALAAFGAAVSADGTQRGGQEPEIPDSLGELRRRAP